MISAAIKCVQLSPFRRHGCQIKGHSTVTPSEHLGNMVPYEALKLSLLCQEALAAQTADYECSSMSHGP